MSFALSQKKWSYIEGLGKVEVLSDSKLESPKTNPLREKRLSRKPLIPLMLMPFMPITAFAETPINVIQTATMQEKMMTAFAPIIELVQSLAYPVALLVVLGGGLFVMIGNSDKGFQLIQRAGLGYVLVMMLPMLLDVLVDAMKSVV